jgi:GT2 family glycosyltransferase
MPQPKISIIIPLYNQVSFTRLCLEYVERNTPEESHEVILVDNASSDGTESLVASLPAKIRRVRNAVNLGFAKACNQGADMAAGEYLIFLNNDTAPHPGWSEALLDPIVKNPGIGLVGPKLLYADGTIQQAGVVFSNNNVPYHLYAGCAGDLPGANKARFFKALTAACFLVSRSDFFAAGCFDTRYVNGLEDMHFCMALGKLGKRILYNPESRVTHFESRSENRQAAMTDNLSLFLREWHSQIVQDDFRYFLEDGMDFWVIDNKFRFLSKERGDAMAKDLLAQVEVHIRMGDLKKAEQYYSNLLARNPYNTVTLLGIAKAMERFGMTDACGLLRNLAEKYSRHA